MTTIQNNEQRRSSTLDKSSIFTIDSFCSVVTKEVCKDAHILALSLNSFYSRPIVFFCDQDVALYFSKNKVCNLHCIIVDFEKPSKVKEHNNYHRSDAISRKMDAMTFCIKRYGNTMFLDSDIILLAPFCGPRFCNVALSHNLSVTHYDVSDSIKNDGMFNAGMVWSSSVKFVKWWMDAYLKGESSFYEQECLNRVFSQDFNVDYIDLGHNAGFWRGSINGKNPLSLHCHLDTEFISKINNEWIYKKIHSFRREVMEFLSENRQDLHGQIINILK